MWNKLWPLGLLAITYASCKSKKAVVEQPPKSVAIASTSKATLFNRLLANSNALGYYSATGKATYQDKDQKVDLTASIVMEKNRYIWLKCNAFLGIEVARMMLTNDSVVILDQIHRKAIITDYSYIRRVAGLSLNLSQIQNLVIGNSLFEHDEKTALTDTVMMSILVSQALNQAQSATTAYNQNTYKVQRTIVIDQAQSKECRIEYAQPHNYQDNQYPSDININIRAEKNMQCRFQLSNFVFEKKKEVVFSIPKSYEVVRP